MVFQNNSRIVKIDLPSSITSEDEELVVAVKSALLLGYTVPLKEQVHKRPPLPEINIDLRNVLRSLGMEPMDTAEIEQDKEKKNQEAIRNSGFWGRHLRLGESIVQVGWTLLGVFVLTLLCGVGFQNEYLVVRGCSHLFLLLGPLLWIYNSVNTAKSWRWEAVPLHQYTSQIPASALQKAFKIKEVLETAKFHVEELVGTNDPLFSVTYNGQRIYLEEWGAK